MKKRTVMIGVVILVIGIALVIGGGIGALRSITINTTFTQPHSGEYLSSEIILNKTSDLVVSSPASLGGIVSANDSSIVTSTNINSYAVSYSSSGAGSYVYKSLIGDYYYVAFTSSQPGTRVVATAQGSGVVAFGVLVLLGIVLAIVGIVVAVVGAVQKQRPPVEPKP